MTYKQMKRFCEDGCYECPFSDESFFGFFDEDDYDYEYEDMCNIMSYSEEEIINEYVRRFGPISADWQG